MSDLQKAATKPDPYAPYRISQAIRVADFVFVSGQAAPDESGALVCVGDFDAQAEQTFRNLDKDIEHLCQECSASALAESYRSLGLPLMTVELPRGAMGILMPTGD